MNADYLNNGYFFLSCNACDRVIKKTEMTEDEYNSNGGYCPECFNEMLEENKGNCCERCGSIDFEEVENPYIKEMTGEVEMIKVCHSCLIDLSESI